MDIKTVYIVTMYRWGSKEDHSYVLGCYSKKSKALLECENEEIHRNQKYSGEVVKARINGKRVKCIKKVKED